MTPRTVRVGAILGLVALVTVPAQAQQRAGAPAQPTQPQATAPAAVPAIEPKAMAVLKASCATLAAAKAMSFDALSTYERAARNGQPLFYATLNRVTMQRPDRLRVITPGDGTPDEFYYDGRAMMAYVPSEDLVAVSEAPPTIDQMLGAAWEKAGIYFPFADVIVSAPCAVFDGHAVDSAFYIGQSRVVGGTVTDMVAVASPTVQAQLRIGAEDRLPRMVRVVYPKEPAHALYQTEYSNWRLLDAAEPGSFASERASRGRPMAFAPPAAREPQSGSGAAGGPAAPRATAAPASSRGKEGGGPLPRRSHLAATAAAALAATAPISPALAWMHGTWGGGGGGGYEHTSWNGDRSSSVSGSGWSHSAAYGDRDRSSSGNWEGSAQRSVSDGGYSRGSSVSPSGWSHSSDYGGYYHGTSGNWGGTATHTGYYGTSTASYGAYYHQPATVGYYGATCSYCGHPGWGTAAAGAAVGVTAGYAAGAAATSAAYGAAAATPPPVAYAALPPG
ncbi:MAG: DUF2092 domain-containing protein, partial [Acetobacteraceae bacterium]|nr:DUF2092 domain-containing protein [Acetobacteraceae bacterium]